MSQLVMAYGKSTKVKASEKLDHCAVTFEVMSMKPVCTDSSCCTSVPSTELGCTWISSWMLCFSRRIFGMRAIDS